jgi:hypothetical protein
MTDPLPPLVRMQADIEGLRAQVNDLRAQVSKAQASVLPAVDELRVEVRGALDAHAVEGHVEIRRRLARLARAVRRGQ